VLDYTGSFPVQIIYRIVSVR